MSLQPSLPGALPPPSQGALNRAVGKHAAEKRRRDSARRLREEVAEARALGVAVVVKPRLDRSWSEEEEDVLRALYPDFPRMCERLPHRSRTAIGHRVAGLDLVPPQKRWTPAEVATLRRMWAKATPDELRAALPRWPADAIRRKGSEVGLKPRGRAPLKLTGDPLCDAIRDRCRVLGYSMAYLDRISHTSTYWSACEWNNAGGHRLTPMVRALHALGGEIDVRWPD